MLEKYRAKRKFEQTSEPQGKPSDGVGALTFVIQEHHARRLHWDLRLELDGVLKSWAVPKGVSTNPDDKHLAVMVEDHPYDYGAFEGEIAKGNYGAGKVIIWDSGTYAPDEPTVEWGREKAQPMVRKALADGKLSFTIHGRRLWGSWALVRMKKDEDNWLIFKHREERDTEGRPSAQAEPMPKRIEPMLASEKDEAFDDAAWSFEPKLDGVRVIAYKRGGQITLISRGGLEIQSRFPRVVTALAKLDGDMILDGELIALSEGKPDFQTLMDAYHGNIKDGGVHFYVFDALYAAGKSLVKDRYEDRRAALIRTVPKGVAVSPIDSIEEHGKLLYENAVELGFEGIIAKRRASYYQQGKRGPDWLKIKQYESDDFFVVGWQEGKGGRQGTFGSLLLASMEDGRLIYRGNVGGGFSDRQLEDMTKRLRTLETTEAPLSEAPKIPGTIHWMTPNLRVEVRYMKLTKESRLRMPVFVKLREEIDLPKRAIDPAKPTPKALIERLADMPPDGEIEVEGNKVKYSSLDKVLWPASGEFKAQTKRDLFIYFAKIAPFIIPHLSERPLAFVRFPNGLAGERFFQKHMPANPPRFFPSFDIWSDHNGKPVDYTSVENLAGLFWLAQMGALELHPWQSRVTPDPDAGEVFDTEEGLEESVLNRPDYLVLDLDPYTYSGNEKPGDEPELNKKGWEQGVEVALRLRDMLDTLGWTGFLKTSGKTGLHIFVPLVRRYDYDQVRAMARTLGEHLMAKNMDLITMEWQVKKRPAKVFFDSGQNVMGKTLACIYSPRPAYGAPVSFPVAWDDLRDVYPTDFTIETAPRLLDKHGDRWADILEHAQELG